MDAEQRLFRRRGWSSFVVASGALVVEARTEQQRRNRHEEGQGGRTGKVAISNHGGAAPMESYVGHCDALSLPVHMGIAPEL